MSDTQILWSYPLVFHRIRRVDAKYAYLVVKDGFVPLRRREGVFCKLFPYERYMCQPKQRVIYGDLEYCDNYVTVKLTSKDSLFTFLQIQKSNEIYE